jgi:prepilin-type N-terminal cleavage/methylation domain-containing protein
MRRATEAGMAKGFTLIETAAALAVTAVLLYVAGTSLQNLVPKYRLEKSVWEAGTALHAAKARALYKGRAHRVRFGAEGTLVESYDDARKVWVLEERHTADGVTIEANNAPVFGPDGAVSGLATILISNRWGRYKITLAITGRIKTTKLS